MCDGKITIAEMSESKDELQHRKVRTAEDILGLSERQRRLEFYTWK